MVVVVTPVIVNNFDFIEITGFHGGIQPVVAGHGIGVHFFA